MCGYCTEGAALSSALLASVDSEITAIDPFILQSFAQDAPNWRALASSWPTGTNGDLALLAFCRSWEDALFGKSGLLSLDVLGSTLGTKLSESLLRSIPGPEWGWAMEPRFELPPALPLSSALVMLETYSRCWLAGGRGEQWSNKNFLAWFPWLFLALTIVAEANVEAQVMQKIALTDPARTPAFDGLDLWLQRRAACACVRQQGIAFVEKYFENLRLEALTSALVTETIHSTDLATLRNLLVHRPHEVLNLSVSELLGAIEHK